MVKGHMWLDSANEKELHSLDKGHRMPRKEKKREGTSPEEIHQIKVVDPKEESKIHFPV